MTVRLDVLDGHHIAWVLADSERPGGWESAQIDLISRLLPHIRQFVRVRQVLARADALTTSLAALLENWRIGVIHLGLQGQILSANDRAAEMLRDENALSDEDGILQAREPDQKPRLERLISAALPSPGKVAAGGSMPLRRSDGTLPLVLHVKPMNFPQPDYGGGKVTALVLLTEPEFRREIAPEFVAEILGLTPGESRVAAWLAEGRSVAEMACDTGRTRDAIYWHLKQIYQKHNYFPSGGPHTAGAVDHRTGIAAAGVSQALTHPFSAAAGQAQATPATLT